MGPNKKTHGVTAPLGTEHLHVHFRFKKADPNRFPVVDFGGHGLSCLVKTFADAEGVTWADFKKRRDYRYHPIAPKSFSRGLPKYISPDETIFSIDVLGLHPARLYGYRQGMYFYIVWFDRNHDAIKMS